MLPSMRRFFPSPICPPPPRTTPCSIFWMLMIPLHPLVRELCLQVPAYLAAWTLRQGVTSTSPATGGLGSTQAGPSTGGPRLSFCRPR
jgi:hypothetical protein